MAITGHFSSKKSRKFKQNSVMFCLFLLNCHFTTQKSLFQLMDIVYTTAVEAPNTQKQVRENEGKLQKKIRKFPPFKKVWK